MNKVLILFITAIFVLVLAVYFIQKSKYKQIVINSPTIIQTTSMITVTSLAFKQGEMIPTKYTCDGENVNPPITIADVPINTKSLTLIVDDPDAPVGSWNHWLVWNIDPATKDINENSVPAGAVLGTNDFGKLGYGGPRPPSGTHRYIFKVFALDTILNVPRGAKREKLETAMKNHIINRGELMGKYSR